jgi:pimeloyl-ACP methyl ester carboxylesterase
MDAPPVQYVKTSDGYNIAYSVAGGGEPLVFSVPNFSSVQAVWHQYPDWMQGLAERFHLVTFDYRGRGLSSKGLPEDTSLTAFDIDLATVVERLQLHRPILFARDFDGHHAVRYAVGHPDRVAALIWSAAAERAGAWFAPFFVDLPRENWDLFLASLARGLPPDEQQKRVSEYRSSIAQEDWTVWTRVHAASTLDAELPQLKTPTLVFQSADYASMRQEESMRVAASIPEARFVSTTGPGIYGDAAPGLMAIDAFLKDLPNPKREEHSQHFSPLSQRELEVLRLLANGRNNQQIADELIISLNTVNRHVSNIYAKTGAANRAQAASYATRNGIA